MSPNNITVNIRKLPEDYVMEITFNLHLQVLKVIESPKIREVRN